MAQKPNGLFAYDLATDELQHFESNINGFSHITSNFLQYIMEDRASRCKMHTKALSAI